MGANCCTATSDEDLEINIKPSVYAKDPEAQYRIDVEQAWE